MVPVDLTRAYWLPRGFGYPFYDCIYDRPKPSSSTTWDLHVTLASHDPESNPYERRFHHNTDKYSYHE